MPSVIKSLRWPWISFPESTRAFLRVDHGSPLLSLSQNRCKRNAARKPAELHASLPAPTPSFGIFTSCVELQIPVGEADSESGVDQVFWKHLEREGGSASARLSGG